EIEDTAVGRAGELAGAEGVDHLLVGQVLDAGDVVGEVGGAQAVAGRHGAVAAGEPPGVVGGAVDLRCVAAAAVEDAGQVLAAGGGAHEHLGVGGGGVD